VRVRPNLLVIRVADLGAARIFYGALGLDLKVEKHGAGPEHLSYAKNGFVFEIYPRRSDTDSTSAVRIGFSVPAFDPFLLSKLQDLGAEFVSEPTESEWGRRVVLRDPDGHTVELLEVGYTVEDLNRADPEAFARRQPEMFGLTLEVPDWGKALAERVVQDTKSDRCEITAEEIEGWWVIAASRDWLLAPDGSLDLSYFRSAKPLEGQVNACRSEWLIHAYARTLVTVGPSGRVVLKGVAPDSGRIWEVLASLGATRALAFEGVEATKEKVVPRDSL